MYILLTKGIKMHKDKDNEDSAKKAGKMLYGIKCFTRLRGGGGECF